MSLSAGLVWPEALEEDDERYGSSEQPEFHDASEWAQWLMAATDSDAPDLEKLGCGALLAIYSEGDEDIVAWTSPAAMAAAAERLAALVERGDASVKWVVQQYGDDASSAAERRDAFLQELEVVKVMAAWAEGVGLKRVAFEIG